MNTNSNRDKVIKVIEEMQDRNGAILFDAPPSLERELIADTLVYAGLIREDVPLPSSLTEEERAALSVVKHRAKYLYEKNNADIALEGIAVTDILTVCKLAERSTVWDAAKEYEVCKAFCQRSNTRFNGFVMMGREKQSAQTLIKALENELASMKPSLSQDALPKGNNNAN